MEPHRCCCENFDANFEFFLAIYKCFLCEIGGMACFRPPKFPTIWYKLATAVLALRLLVYIYIQKNRNMLKLLLPLITCSGMC